MSTHTLIPHTTPTSFSTAGGGVTLGVDFVVRKTCSVTAVWFFAPIGAQSLTASVWSYTGTGGSVSDGTLLGGQATTNGSTAGWTNNTWVRVPLSAAQTLTPGNYRAGITTTGGGTYPYTNGYYLTDPGAGNAYNSPDQNSFSAPNRWNGPLALFTPRQAYSNNGSTPTFPAGQAPAMANFWVDVEVSYTNPSYTWAEGTATTFNLDSYANRTAMVAAGWDFLAPVNGGTWDTETGNVTYNPVTVPQVQNQMDWICRDLPSDWVSVQAHMGYSEGSASKGGFGIGIFQDHDNNAFAYAPRGSATATYFPRVVDGIYTGTSLPAVDINIPAFNGTYLRLDRDPYTNNVMAQWSNDGTEWRYIRSFTHNLTNPRLVLANYGGDGTQSVIWHSVTVKQLTQVSTLHAEKSSLQVNLKVGANDVLIGYKGTTKMVTSNYTGNSVKYTFIGDTFDPKIELASGSTATVSWADVDGNILATGVTPSIDLGYARSRTIQMFVRSTGGSDAFDQVRVINLGYNNDDAGLYMTDITTYARPPMLVSGITSLNLCTGLVHFLAGRTPLAGAIDFSGMSALQQVNCFNARIESVNLTGCTSLVRLCLEACAVSTIDLNPVSSNLKDLRIATQYASATGALTGLTFTSITGNMSQLYHYCVRDQPITNHIPNSKLPVVMQRWDWNTGATAYGAPTSSVLTSLLSFGNSYDQSTVDAILAALVSLGATAAQIPAGGDWTLNCDLSGSAAPSSTGAANATTLRGRGWTVITA